MNCLRQNFKTVLVLKLCRRQCITISHKYVQFILSENTGVLSRRMHRNDKCDIKCDSNYKILNIEEIYVIFQGYFLKKRRTRVIENQFVYLTGVVCTLDSISTDNTS